MSYNVSKDSNLLNYSKCNICQSEDIDNFLKKNYWEFGYCRNCGIVFLKNIPSDEDIKNIYNNFYFKDGQKFPTEGFKLDNNPAYINAKKRLKIIREIGPERGRLLDIGCGTGIFLKIASFFYESIGFDISRCATELAVKNLGVKAICGTIFDIDFRSQLFDVITMWDVIEHLKDPNNYIEKVSQIIRPGGLLVLSTGNIKSLMFRIQKKNWHLLTPPQHLFYFSPQTISVLLKNHGFKIIKISYNGQYTNVGYIVNKLKQLHNKNKLIRLIDLIIKTTKINSLNIYLNLYDVMTIYAKKI
ncbi:MAG: class I SAM-dependent methyltransferase [Nitrospirota bacterium]